MTDITPRHLRDAARMAWKLDALLYTAVDDGVMPMLIGFDLDFLASQFEEAAKRLEAVG